MNDTYPEPVDDVTYNHNSPTGINNFDNTCNKDQPISFVIEQSGLRSLVENPDPDDVLRAVRKFAELSSGKDEAWLGIAISEIKKILKEANVYTNMIIVLKRFFVISDLFFIGQF